MSTLLVTVISTDRRLSDELFAAVPAVGTGARIELRGAEEVIAHQVGDAPDVVFVDPATATAFSAPELRTHYPSSFVVVVARAHESTDLEFGEALGADAYLRRDDRVREAASALIAIAGVAALSPEY